MAKRSFERRICTHTPPKKKHRAPSHPSFIPFLPLQAAAYVAGCGMLTARLGAYCTARLSAATLKRLCVRVFLYTYIFKPVNQSINLIIMPLFFYV